MCYDIDRALGFMLKYMPPVARCFSSTQELAQFVQSDKKKEGHLAKLVLNNHCHLWGMVVGKTFVGLDFGGQHVALDIVRIPKPDPLAD